MYSLVHCCVHVDYCVYTLFLCCIGLLCVHLVSLLYWTIVCTPCFSVVLDYCVYTLFHCCIVFSLLYWTIVCTPSLVPRPSIYTSSFYVQVGGSCQFVYIKQLFIAEGVVHVNELQCIQIPYKQREIMAHNSLPWVIATNQ